MIKGIIGLFTICGFIFYCCCVTAGRADEKAERIYSEYKKKNHPKN